VAGLGPRSASEKRSVGVVSKLSQLTSTPVKQAALLSSSWVLVDANSNSLPSWSPPFCPLHPHVRPFKLSL